MATYDIVFLIDNTGSMSPYIESVKENVTSLVRTLQRKELDFRLGLIEFGDTAEEIGVPKKHDFSEDDFATEVTSPTYFTTDVEKFIEKVNLIEAEAGGDWSESGLEALMEALTMDFSESAFKNFIVVTDADFHNQGEYGDGDYSTYLNPSDVLATLSDSDVRLDVIGTVDYYTQNEWESLAQFTGGTLFDIQSDFTFVLNAITREQSIPENPLVYNNHSYYVFNAQEVNVNSWEQAQAYCKARGGHLAVITSPEENQKIYDYMVSSGISSAYFGLSDSETEGSWKWANGEAFNYTNWTENAPEYDSTEYYYNNYKDYAAFQADGSGKWVDNTFYNYSDDSPIYFICEWSPKEAQAGSGADIENALDDVTVTGTPNNDNIYNSGKRVVIEGLAGDDAIHNFSKELVRGESATINAGAGNDIINCASSDHIIYNVGDGDETIYCNWTTSHTEDFKIIPAPALTIHLESGNFKGATLGRTSDEVILNVNSNKITLNRALNQPIKIIAPNGVSFEFNGGIYELKKFERGIIKDSTITAENHDGYYGELIKANNGTVEVEPGDKVTTDKKGNVSLIQIADKNHRVKSLLDKPVKIQDTDGNQIAEVLGETEIYWNEERQPVIEVADIDKAITVDALADNLKIIGSNLQDNIKFAGKENYVYSGLGNDFIQSDGISATVVGGSDDDTIKLLNDSELNIKLNSGTVQNASLNGSDVIITTNYDHVITVQDGQEKNIIVTNAKNKILPTINNEYEGDPDVLIDKAADLREKARRDLESRTAEELESSFQKIDSQAADELDKFKKSFKMIPGSTVKLNEIPPEVFESFAKKIYEQVSGSSIGTLNALKPASWIGNVANAIKNIGVEEFPVGDYTVSAQKFIGMGTGTAYITIKKDGATWAQLTFADSQDKMIAAAEDYLKSLSTLNENAWWRVVTGLVEDATGSTKAGKYLTYAKEIIKAIADPEDYGTVDKTLVSTMKKELNPTISGSVVEEAIKEFCPQPLKKIILDGCAAYRDIKKYNTQLNATASFDENQKIYENLLNSYTTLENLLNGKLFSPGQIFSFFGGLFSSELKAGESGLSEESFNNEESTAYISAGGSATDDLENATGSLKVDETKIIYSALKPEAQKLSLGSLTDSKDWEIKTLEGDDEIAVSTSKKATLSSGAGNDTVVVDGAGDLLINAGEGDDVTRIRSDSRSLMTVSGGAGNDFIYSNPGAHVFKYKPEDGQDTVYDYDSYNTIEIESGNVDNVYKDLGGDVIVSVALGGEIKLKDSADKAITIKDSFGETTSKVYENTDETPWFTFDESETTLIFSNAFDGDKLSLEKFDKKIKSIDASEMTRDVDIFGNEESNTLIGGASKSTLTGGAGDDLFIYSKGENIISDYDEGKDKISLGDKKISDVKIADNDIKLSFEDGSLTIADGYKDAKGKDKKISMIDDEKSSKYIFDEHKIFIGNRRGVILTSADDFDAKDYSKLATIDGSAATDEIHITGNNKKNYIVAGAGGSTLDGGKGKDTLVGGDGNDVFVYNAKSGNKIITDYAEDDLLDLSEAKITDAFVKKDNAVLKVGSNKISVQGGESKEITFSSGGEIKVFSDGVIYNEDKTAATIYPKYSSHEEKIFDDTVTQIDASAARKSVNLSSTATEDVTISGGKGKDSLTGSAGNDYLSGGKGKDVLRGNAGSDTLWGGKGNDSLWGSASSDTFIYNRSEGKDIIYGFENDDMLQITGKFSTSFNGDKNEISLKVGSGSVTLKDYTATEFNINEEIYVISDGSFNKK